MKKISNVKQVGLLANEEEMERLELIRATYARHTYSDTIRFLINQEAEKILNQNTANAVIQKRGEA